MRDCSQDTLSNLVFKTGDYEACDCKLTHTWDLNLLTCVRDCSEDIRSTLTYKPTAIDECICKT